MENCTHNSRSLLENFCTYTKIISRMSDATQQSRERAGFFSCYRFPWNDSVLLKAMNMNQTYLCSKDPTVSAVIKIFHFSCSNQSTCHSPLKLLLLHGAPTSLREKVLFVKNNKNLPFYVWGDSINSCLGLWFLSGICNFLFTKKRRIKSYFWEHVCMKRVS